MGTHAELEQVSEDGSVVSGIFFSCPSIDYPCYLDLVWPERRENGRVLLI